MAPAVQRQVVLPWRQVVRIALNSLRARFYRSLITTVSLALAVAFVAYLWFGYDILNSMWPGADQPLKEHILGAGYELSPDGQFGSTAKDRWLAILSLLVCVVGSVNAQLMAVTERFREIGTFKCLGALNSFVVRIFVLEAMFQGCFGGLAGGIAGTLIAAIGQVMKFGWAAFVGIPALRAPVVVGAVTLLAVALSFIGVLYPSLVAARMRPAVALRAE